MEGRGVATILVVDDEDIVLSILSRSFEKVGYRVLTAKDGETAVDVFREHHEEIAGVILDLSMPGMGGEQTFEALREIRSDVLVLLSSGFTESEALERCQERGAVGFLQKPFRPVEVIARVKSAFALP